MWGTRIKDLPFKLVVQSQIEIWRAADFWTKEPETIAWIDSFEPRSVFWDIGANVGVFSLYAASMGKIVTGFEPCKENWQRFQENIKLNGFDNSIDIFEYGISDFEGQSTFAAPYVGVGKSGGQIGLTNVPNHPVFVTTIDKMANLNGIPNYIKIDVDGIEAKILKGGYQTLGKSEVRGVLVEINNNHEMIENYMIDLGFTGFNRFNASDVNRRIGQPSYNRIYTRSKINENA